MLAGKELPRRLTVFELDPERVAFLKQAADTIGFAIEVVPHDLREPLAGEFLDAFDTFQTDPPYTIPGASLFVRRGVEALDHGRGYGMLSFGHTSPPDRLKLQQALTSLGVATTALYPAFNAYAGASILGSTSELHELVATGKPHRLKNGRARSTPPKSIRASGSMPVHNASTAGVWVPRKSRRRSKSSRPPDVRPAAIITFSASGTDRTHRSFPCHRFALAFAQGNGGFRGGDSPDELVVIPRPF